MSGVPREITFEVDSNGCHNCTSHRPDKAGYPRASSSKTGTNILHRQVFISLHGPLPRDVVVRHTCDNRMCINPTHLVAGSQQDNVDDCHTRGRARCLKGQEHPRAVMREADVEYVLYSAETNISLADMFNVSPTVISDIRKRKTWTHVPIRNP